MRKILKIAKLELSILFYSPVAWLVLAIFVIQCALSFLDNLQNINTALSLGYQTRPITNSLFGGSAGLFSSIQGNLYLYLPILTMGLMSREINSGSIKLLLSSPVKLREIILGKYLAIIGYGLTLILVLALYGLIGLVTIPNADAGCIFGGLLGLYLLICTYAAIGLFMSCLTTYQVVAAISTLAVFAILRFVGSLGQDIDFVRDLTYFLSISGRTDKMISGLITTKDVCYYLIIIATFLSLAILRLKTERELKPWRVKAGRYMLLICSALLLGYLTSRPTLIGYWDVTKAKSLTITRNSQEIARQIKGELKVTSYANMLAPYIWNLLPQSRNTDRDRLERYKRFIPGMKVSYTYYYEKPVDSNYADYRHNPNIRDFSNTDKIADQMATNMDVDRGLFKPRTSIDEKDELKSEGYLNVRKLEYNGKSTFIRFFMGDGESDPYPGEAEMMAAIKRLLAKTPRVIFLTGNNERNTVNKDDRGYQMISMLKIRRAALINQGFDVDTLDLNAANIPADVDVVVLADPTIPFDAAAQQKLQTYVNRGGNLLITGDPERITVLNPLLQLLGLQLKKGILVKPGGSFSPDFIHGHVADAAASLDSNLQKLNRYERGVAMQGAAAIDYINKGMFTVVPLLMSPKAGWNKAETLDPTVANLTYHPAAGDEQGEFPVAVALTRNVNHKQQRIVVSGDADFMSNGELSRGKRGANEYYMQGLFRWLGHGTFPVDVSRPDPLDMKLDVKREQITVLMYLCKGVIPALIAIMGAILLFKRRRN